MNSEALTVEQNALQILAKAAEGYITGLNDELAKAFITPQVQKAFEIVAAVVQERWPKQEAPVDQEAPVAHAEVTKAKKKTATK